MLTMTKKGWLGWSYKVQNEAREPVADLSLAAFGDSGSFVLQGALYLVEHEGWLGRRFRLEREGVVVARTRKGSAGHTFELEAGEACYSLKQKSFASSEYLVLDGPRGIGSIQQPSWGRDAHVNVGAEISLPVQVFLLWLAALLWKWQVT